MVMKMNFGQRLRKLRENKKITQKELSKILNVSESAIGMYERGEREPNFETVDKIANFFNVPTDYLLGRTDDPTPPGQAADDDEDEHFFFSDGGENWTEEEIEIARQAAKLAVEAYRRGQQKNK